MELEASERIVGLYTKDGKLGAYGSYLILVPYYDVGFTVLAAGFSSNADVLVGSFLTFSCRRWKKLLGAKLLQCTLDNTRLKTRTLTRRSH